MNNKPTYISLFSSAGVGCYGFKINDFECIATNELLEKRLNIQKYNNKCKYPSGYICGDITDVNVKKQLFDEVIKWKKINSKNDIDVIIATPPCQGMSVANHKKSTDEIRRNSLVVESIKIVSEIAPKFFVFENVQAFLKTLCTDLNDEIKTIGESIDDNLNQKYSIQSRVLNFKNYGSNSSRTRTIVIGVRRDFDDYISPFELFPDFVQEQTLHQTIGSLASLQKFGEIDKNDIYHFFRTYPEHMREWIVDIKEGESAFDNLDPNKIPHKVIDNNIVYNKQKNGDKYKRQVWDKVAPCIHTRNDQFASQNTIHPCDDRVFSIRELMKMMSIPDNFKWSSILFEDLNKFSIEEKRKFLKKEEFNIRQSIGEAVPTKIFENIAFKIKRFIECKHLKTAEINREIERFNLLDFNSLCSFIESNPNNLGLSSLSTIAEFSNNLRTKNAAYFTNKSLITEMLNQLPEFNSNEIHILEPSVGVGNFLSLIAKKYEHISKVIIDVVDIDPNVINILKILVQKMSLPSNITVNYIVSDFLLLGINKKYDLVIGNPPFSKLSSKDKNLVLYKENSYNDDTTNTFAFFLEKSLRISKYVSLITPKFLLNTPEFRKTRNLIENMKVSCILDFGEKGFKGVLVETIAVFISTDESASKTLIKSYSENIEILQNQSYIFDNSYPYWLLYRNKDFDKVAKKLNFNIFTVFRDRQITNKLINSTNGIRVIRSRNISDDGSRILDILNYDSYIENSIAETLSVYKYIDSDDTYLTPNMTYKPRVIRKPKGVIVNGSAAILILKDGEKPLTDFELQYFSKDEYRVFYKIARNYQTRSLNIDSSSVFFFGRIRED